MRSLPREAPFRHPQYMKLHWIKGGLKYNYHFTIDYSEAQQLTNFEVSKSFYLPACECVYIPTARMWSDMSAEDQCPVRCTGHSCLGRCQTLCQSRGRVHVPHRCWYHCHVGEQQQPVGAGEVLQVIRMMSTFISKDQIGTTTFVLRDLILPVSS